MSLTENSAVLDASLTAWLPPNAAVPATGAAVPATDSPSPRASLEQVQRDHILAALTKTSWVIDGPSGAAAILNLHPNTLRSRMKKLGIARPSRS